MIARSVHNLGSKKELHELASSIDLGIKQVGTEIGMNEVSIVRTDHGRFGNMDTLKNFGIT
jgi:hypothetical protein